MPGRGPRQPQTRLDSRKWASVLNDALQSAKCQTMYHGEIQKDSDNRRTCAF